MPKIIHDEDIFKAVKRVIIERGYAGATTKEMADAAHVSEMTLFRKYKSKAQLVRLAIISIADQMSFDAEALYSGDVYADLLNISERYRNSVVYYIKFLTVLAPEVQRSPELAGSLDKPREIMHEISLLLARYQAKGKLRTENPFHTVAALLGPLIYTAMLKGSLFDSDLPVIDLPQYVENFLKGRQTTIIS